MKIRKFFVSLCLSAVCLSGYTQGKPDIWTELEFSKEIVKDLKFEFNPELRLLDDYKMDSYILEGGFTYKALKYLSVAGYYRFEEAWDYKKSTGAYKGRNSYNRLAFDLKSGFDFMRFSVQGRIRYTRELDPGSNATELRYRAKVDYNIKGVKLNPFVSVELFNDRSVTALEKESISGGFKDIDKIRYTGGLAYSINKKNEVSAFYRLQDNRIKNESTNIVGLSFSRDF